jgi:hypothetical protein
MFDPTKPVQTRDGRKARILATDLDGKWPVAAVVEESPGHWLAYSFDEDGLRKDTRRENYNHLINLPAEFEVEIEAFRVKWGDIVVRASGSLAFECDIVKMLARKTIRIREGEGLE